MIREKLGDCRVLEVEIVSIELFFIKFSSEKNRYKVWGDRGGKVLWECLFVFLKDWIFVIERVKRKINGIN